MNLKPLLFLSILFFCSQQIFGQSDSIQIKVNVLNNGYTINLGDAIVFGTDKDKKFKNYGYFPIYVNNLNIILPANEKGTFRIFYNLEKYKFIDVPYHNEKFIEINLDAFDILKPEVLTQGVARDFNNFNLKWNFYDSAYQSLVKQYFEESNKKKKKKIQTEIKALEKEINKYLISYTKRSDILGFIARNRPFIYRNLKHNEGDFISFWRKNYWKNIQITDDIYFTFECSKWIQDYFNFYFAYFGEADIMEEAKSGIDILMQKFISNGYEEYAFESLHDIFEQNNMARLVKYLEKNYPSNMKHKGHDHDSHNHNEKEAKQEFKKGELMPDIKFNFPISANIESLSQIESDTLLLIFWSSTCPYCKISLEKLSSLVISKNIAILTITADQSQEIFDAYKLKYPEWLHYCDFEGWNSPIIEAFRFDTTPTFILMDREKNFLFKTSIIEQLIKVIEGK